MIGSLGYATVHAWNVWSGWQSLRLEQPSAAFRRCRSCRVSARYGVYDDTERTGDGSRHRIPDFLIDTFRGSEDASTASE